MLRVAARVLVSAAHLLNDRVVVTQVRDHLTLRGLQPRRAPGRSVISERGCLGPHRGRLRAPLALA